MDTAIRHIENLATGSYRIGLVRFTNSGRVINYAGRVLRRFDGPALGPNCFDIETGEAFRVTRPSRDGVDGCHGRTTQPEDVDADVADAYWQDIRGVRAGS